MCRHRGTLHCANPGDVSKVCPSLCFRPAFAYMAQAFLLPCNLPRKCRFTFSSLVKVWIAQVPEHDRRLYPWLPAIRSLVSSRRKASWLLTLLPASCAEQKNQIKICVDITSSPLYFLQNSTIFPWLSGQEAGLSLRFQVAGYIQQVGEESNG